MTASYEVEWSATVTCDRCGRTASHSSRSRISHDGFGAKVTPTMLKDTLAFAGRDIGASAFTINGAEKHLCGDCTRILTAILTPLSTKEEEA